MRRWLVENILGKIGYGKNEFYPQLELDLIYDVKIMYLSLFVLHKKSLAILNENQGLRQDVVPKFSSMYLT